MLDRNAANAACCRYPSRSASLEGLISSRLEGCLSSYECSQGMADPDRRTHLQMSVAAEDRMRWKLSGSQWCLRWPFVAQSYQIEGKRRELLLAMLVECA